MAKKIKSFNNIIGHKNLIRYLQECIKKDIVPQIIIFHGNPGIGKSSIAKLLAIEIVTKYEEQETRGTYIKSVIEENKSTDSIKIFNMSEIQEKEEEIQKVKAELTVGFSSTGRKVLILDEAHNISKKAQDAVLTDLEHLAQDVYVFICTTEIASLRDALVSRSKATLRLNDLTIVETRKLVATLIADRQLTFDVSSDMVTALIADWAGYQPRKACNLLENFPVGTCVTSKDLEVFIDTNSVASIIELLKYLYGSMVLGIDYLDSLRYDNSFTSVLIEVCKVALGHVSQSISPKDTIFIRKFMENRDVKHILLFTVEVTGLSSLQKRRIISAFMRAHVTFSVEPPVKDYSKVFQSQDMLMLIENVEKASVFNSQQDVEKVATLEEMFSNSELML